MELLISRNGIIDIKKLISWYQEFEFLISRNRILDIKKYLLFFISRNRILDIKNRILDIKNSISWYQEIESFISKKYFLISKNISWYQELGVKKRTNNVLIYAETGRLPLKVCRLIRIFKFWFKLLRTENCILGDAYKFLLMQCNDVTFRGTNWLSSVKIELFRLGLGYMWTEQNTLSFSKHFPVIKQKIIDICVQGFIADINSSQNINFFW